MAFPNYNTSPIFSFYFCPYSNYLINNIDNQSNTEPYFVQNNTNTNNYNNYFNNSNNNNLNNNEERLQNQYIFNYNSNNTSPSSYLLPNNNLNLLNNNNPNISPTISNFQLSSSLSLSPLPSPLSSLSSQFPGQLSPEFRKIKRTKFSNNTRVGKCEHPKHVYYREYNPNINHILSMPSLFLSSLPPSESSSESTLLKSSIDSFTFPQEIIKATHSTPRRGRPPKGFKSNGIPIDNQYCQITMTIRSLPKRLEPVVGKKNIYVCLTCLKRTDTDWDYLTNPLYIGPQTTKKKQDSN